MDTGLNNKNALHLVFGQEVFKDVEWLVEANSNERHTLWSMNHERFKWEQVSEGVSWPIMEMEINPVNLNAFLKVKEMRPWKRTVEVLPVCIDFSFAIIDGHKVCFYSSNSRLTHSGYIEAFLLTYFQRTHDGYTRWNHTDANNFHNCINYLGDVDVVERDTKYKVKAGDLKYHIFEPVFELIEN
jgi:hypothetical protein